MTQGDFVPGSTAEEELRALCAVLPPAVRQAVEAEGRRDELLEVVLDLGRQPEARFADRDVPLSDDAVTRADLDHVMERVSDFGDDNRAGVERTLHRISAIRNRRGEVVGVTCRVGRAVHGSARVIEDFALSGKSILLVGRPGVGKTTILRELARALAGARKRVVIVDTSNEIAGDGDIPHPAIGKARRMQVASSSRQHAVMIEAVENHMPEVIVVDEIQGVDEQSANPMRTLHVGRHGCPIMIVGVGLQHSPGILSQHGISRMSHHQLEPLRSAESVAAIYHGLHNIGVDVDDDVAQALAKASMNFPVHVHSYIKAAATVFDEHGEVNSNFAKSRILALGKESREHYYDDRLRGIAKVNKLHPLVEHMAARDVTAVPLDMASSIIDEETIDNATRHGVLTVDHRDMTLSFGIPAFRTYMVELAQRYRRALMVGRDGNSPAH